MNAQHCGYERELECDGCASAWRAAGVVRRGWCGAARADLFFLTRFENLVAKRRKINDRVVPILVAVRNWNDVICLSRSEKVAEFA